MIGTENIKKFRSEILQKMNEELTSIEITSPAGYSVKQTLMYSSATTWIWVLSYTIKKRKYADLYVICFPGKEYYTSKTQIMNEYFPTVLKRFEKCVQTLRNLKYKVTSSQIVFVGNFSADLIGLIKETKELFGVKTSMRALPFGKIRLFHRIRNFIVRTKEDVIVALLYWLGTWIRERQSALIDYLKGKGEKPNKNLFSNLLNRLLQAVMLKVSIIPGDVLAKLEPPPP